MELKDRIGIVIDKFNRKDADGGLATYIIDGQNEIVGVVNRLLVGDEMSEVIYGISKLLENDEWVSVVNSFCPSRELCGKFGDQRARERQQNFSLYIITPRLIFAADRRFGTAVSDSLCLKEGVNVQLVREEEMDLQFCGILFNFHEEVERVQQNMVKNKGHWVYKPGPQYVQS